MYENISVFFKLFNFAYNKSHDNGLKIHRVYGELKVFVINTYQSIFILFLNGPCELWPYVINTRSNNRSIQYFYTSIFKNFYLKYKNLDNWKNYRLDFELDILTLKKAKTF